MHVFGRGKYHESFLFPQNRIQVEDWTVKCFAITLKIKEKKKNFNDFTINYLGVYAVISFVNSIDIWNVFNCVICIIFV